MRAADIGTALALAALGLGLTGCAQPVGVRSAAIVGGEVTGDFPEVAAMLYDQDFHCSAVLVGARELVTAAHCVYGLENDLAPLAVAFGPDLDQSPPTRALMAAVIHPEYATNPSRDIAVLTLAEDAPVPPIPWNEAPLDAVAGPLTLTLVGFGDPALDDDGGPRLRRTVQVPLSELTSTTARWNEVGAGTCHGDSGGAAYADLGGGLVLIGVNSEGDPSCSGWGSAVRTDVFAEFLAEPAPGDDDDEPTLGGDDDDALLDPPARACAQQGQGSAGLWGWLLLLGAGLGRLARRQVR